MQIEENINIGYKGKQTSWFFVICGAIITFVAVAGFWFSRYIEMTQAEVTSTALVEVMKQRGDFFNMRIKQEQRLLAGLAITVSHVINDPQKIEEALAICAKGEGGIFDRVGFCNLHGDVFFSDGMRGNISDREYLQKILSGLVVVTEPMKSRLRDEQVMIVGVPVFVANKVEGCLLGSIIIRRDHKLVLPGAFDDKGAFEIIDDSGKTVLASDNFDRIIPHQGNLSSLDWLVDANFHYGETYETFRRKLLNEQQGVCLINYKGLHLWLAFGPIGTNSWNILAIVPDYVIARTSNSFYVIVILVSLGLVMLLMFLFFMYYRDSKHWMTKMERVACYDEMTGIYNQFKFRDEAMKLLRSGGGCRVVVVLDIVRMKHFNDTFGFPEGDELIKNVAYVLAQKISKGELYGRASEDMFCLLLWYESDVETFNRLSDIVTRVEENFQRRHPDDVYHLSFNCGAYVVENTFLDPDAFIDNAKYACELIETLDKCNVKYYDAGIKAEVLRKQDIDNRMEPALVNGEFHVYLQPKYRLADRRVVGMEALVRWISGDEVLSPSQFIPIFENNGFICRLDFYMFEQTCKILRSWVEKGMTPVPISVNFSRLHLSDPQLTEKLYDIANQYDVPMSLLEIELTESAVWGNEQQIRSLLNDFHRIGLSMSMDDFGSGYSSLGLLKDIPVDAIKMDRSFFTGDADKKRSRYFVTKVIYMLKGYGILTVAEGIETQDQIDILAELGCDVVQGYYFARPMSVEHATALLNSDESGDAFIQ